MVNLKAVFPPKEAAFFVHVNFVRLSEQAALVGAFEKT